jgi:hypothetical protein
LPRTRAELLAAVDGFADPVSAYLRQAATPDGVIGSDWREILEGVGDVLGCPSSTERNFVVLSNLALTPKALATRCTDDPQHASELFAVLEPDEAGADIDPLHLRLAAWDAQAGSYRRYQLAPHPAGGLGIAVEPQFCAACHGGPFGSTQWVPIMNEMTNPWAQWNAEPGFASFLFDEPLAEQSTGVVFEDVVDSEQLESASRLEPIVRAAIDRVTAVRIAGRSDSADLDQALELVRPLFCDESVNFVSEIHRSGEVRATAFADAGLRRMFLALDPVGWPWTWLTDETVHLVPPAANEQPLALFAVRGESTVQAEAALVSRGVLTPEQVLRVKALDWIHPVGSSLRCDLFESGRDRFERGSTLEDNVALVRVLYDGLMQLETDGGLVDLKLAGDRVYAVADAEDPATRAALEAGDLGGFEVSWTDLGAAI